MRKRTSLLAAVIVAAGAVIAATMIVSPARAARAAGRCTAPNELSGPSWVSQFPGSDLVSALSGTFRQDVTDFISAMRRAGITVTVIETLRPPEQAYLMHYSWLIARGKIDPADVPPSVPGPRKAPVSICWQHTDSRGAEDLAASIQAAKEMVRGYHISLRFAVAPALNSLHTKGLAIDMVTTWSKATITIIDGNGHRVRISASPHSGLNSRLIAVGATYRVIHFLGAAGDPAHWSVNGH